MSLWTAWVTALLAVWRNTLRSVLATIGIVIAVMAVVATVAVGEGAKTRVANDMASLGTNLIFVWSGSARKGGVRAGAGTGNALTLADAQAIAQELPALAAHVAPMVRTPGQVVAGSNNWATSIMGTSASYFAAYNWRLAEGAFFTDTDDAQANKVCVIGANVAAQLFKDTVAVGQNVRVRAMTCTVIGVLQKKGQSGFGQDQDDMLVMPLNTLTKRVQPLDHNKGVYVVVAAIAPQFAPTLEVEVANLLRQRHKLTSQDADDFSIFNLSELQQSAARQMGTISLLLSGVALISLVVGAIGIANVMLVSVTERTKEIGLRMAIGARGRDILAQFLLEAMTLSLLGGVMGLGLGIALAAAASRLGQWPMQVDAATALIALAAAAVAGIGAGFYPALRASRLDPIVALRFD